MWRLANLANYGHILANVKHILILQYELHTYVYGDMDGFTIFCNLFRECGPARSDRLFITPCIQA